MPTEPANELLNDLLIEIYRSLVQYAAEAWTWSAHQDLNLNRVVTDVAERQRQDVGRLFEFLRERGHRVDLGVYPHEFTSLHYVAIEYLYGQLLSNQQDVVDLLESSLPKLAEDVPAQTLIKEVAASQREGLQTLRSVHLPGGELATAWMK